MESRLPDLQSKPIDLKNVGFDEKNKIAEEPFQMDFVIKECSNISNSNSSVSFQRESLHETSNKYISEDGSEEWSSDSVDLSDCYIKHLFKVDTNGKKKNNSIRHSLPHSCHSEINMPTKSEVISRNSSEDVGKDSKAGSSFISNESWKSRLNCVELENSPGKANFRCLRKRWAGRIHDYNLEQSISVGTVSTRLDLDPMLGESVRVRTVEKGLTRSQRNIGVKGSSSSSSDFNTSDDSASLVSCDSVDSSGFDHENITGSLHSIDTLENNKCTRITSSAQPCKRFEETEEGDSTLHSVSSLSDIIMIDSRSSSRNINDSRPASSTANSLATSNSRSSRHGTSSDSNEKGVSRNSRTLDVESISSSRCRLSERGDRKQVTRSDSLPSRNHSATSCSVTSYETSESRTVTTSSCSKETSTLPSLSAPTSYLKASRSSSPSGRLSCSKPTSGSDKSISRYTTSVSSSAPDSNSASRRSTDMSGSLTSSQETESTTSIATSSSDSDSTTVYSSSSSSSDSSWLDYEYAAYIFKPKYEKNPEWVKSLLEKFSSTSQTCDATVKEDLDLYHDADSKLQEDLLKTTQLIYSCGESGKMVPRLREPRSLYALNKELGPQQAARWPADLQVINERIKHIQTIPTEPEPFYKQTGFEKCPMVRGEANGGKVAFSYEANSSFFMKSRVGGSRNGCDQCSISLQSENDTTLIFESRFESGNLGKAVQVGERDYELWLRHDLYTNKHTQWFYFRVSNTRAYVEYRFTIVNFMKSDSLYNDGMKPVMYSEKEAELNKVGWIRAGNNIKYYKNNLRYEMGKGERYYYSMTWTIQFKHDRDTVYFSHCYPYTYTDLQNYLLDLTNDPIKSRICKQRVLCRTLAGNLVYVITITSASQNPEDMKHKKAVVVTSRVHPGESNSSWMLKGFLDFVTSSSPDAKLLRDSFIFKVVPMLNPDGVIVGNYRCSLTGRDLNRNYKTALKDAYPSVFHTKQMIRKLLLERDVIVYCDLHGHSRRQNVFIYGCEQPHRSNKRFHERIFPSMLNRNTPEKFCYDSCKFKVQKSKEGTGRVVMWNMGIMNSYTMEATFCGSSLGKKKGFHFNQRDFEMMGYHFCDTLLDYCDPDMTKCDQILYELKQKHHMMVLAKMAEKGLQVEDFPEVDMSTDTESSDDGSDSSISDGPPVHLQFTAPKPKKKKLRSKREREKLHKEEARKTTPVQEDKKMRNNQVKPLKPDNGKTMKYSTNIPKRTRSLDDRTNSGIPVFVQERFEEKQQKKHEYLEALTAAYINNNIPIVTDPGELDNELITMAASEEADLKSDKRTVFGVESPKPMTVMTRQPSKIAMATTDIWSSEPVIHFRYSGKNSEFLNSHPHPEPSQPRPSQAAGSEVPQSNGEALTDSARFQSVFRELDLHRITPKWLQEEASRIYARRGDDSPFKISRIFGRREVASSETSVEDILKSSLTHSASSSLARRKHKPHLLEVSAAQQRQTETLSHDRMSSIKTHPNPFDEISDASRAAPSDQTSQATVSSVTPVKVVQLQSSDVVRDIATPQAPKKSGKSFREKSGRKSRKSMRYDEENCKETTQQNSVEEGTPSSTESRKLLTTEHRTLNLNIALDVKAEMVIPKISAKSAKNGRMKSTEISNVQDIKKALTSTNTDLSTEGVSNAGDYIQKLIKDTSEEIKDLTNEIQQDLEKKQLKSREASKMSIMDFKDQQFRENTQFSERTPTASAQLLSSSGSELMSHSSSSISETKKTSSEKNLFPSVLSSPHLVTDSFNQAKLEEITKFSPLDSVKISGEMKLILVNGKNKDAQEELSRSRSLKRHSSLTSMQSSNNRVPAQGRHSTSQVNNSSGNVDRIIHPTLGSVPQKMSRPVLEDPDDGASHRQPYPSSLLTSYSPIAKGVRLNKHNLVFKGDGQHPENGGVNTSRSLVNYIDVRETQEGELGDNTEPSRSRSAKSSSRQVIETIPTKISLIICQDHQDTGSMPASHLLSLSRQGQRSLFSRQQVRRK